ncbi:MAG: two-component regulator propeller domain-containing protein, partial [Anaerolineae bacterium]
MESRVRLPVVAILLVLALMASMALHGLRALAVPAQDEPSLPAGSGTGARVTGRDITFRRLTLDDGLSQSSINCIVQDAQGFMWFGTQDGLNRYDGYEIEVYRPEAENPSSLSDKWIVG